jgi:hypothetical protein
MAKLSYIVVFISCLVVLSAAWNSGHTTISRKQSTSLMVSAQHFRAATNKEGLNLGVVSTDRYYKNDNSIEHEMTGITNRRGAVVQAAAVLSSSLLILTNQPSRASAAAAVSQRCSPEDPRCGADGVLREKMETKPIPRVTNQITHVVQITYTVGERREEVGFIRFGLYGQDCPGSVKEMLLFLSSGINSMSEEQRRNSIGMQSSPVGLLDGGVVPNVCSSTAVEFGVPSQSKAFAAARGMRTAGPDFVPQPRPPSQKIETFPRPHDTAGLVSIPAGGIGYGGSGTEPDDEAYGSAFLITADAAPAFDSGKSKQRVIGQVIDDASMANLARLASLPTQKGLKGIIPGQTSGPPLLKVSVDNVGVQKVQK